MSTILSQKQYLVGSIGAQLHKNQNAVTMSFNISAYQKCNTWSPIATQIMPKRNYLSAFYISSFLSNLSREDSSEDCKISLANGPECSRHMQHMLSCNKAFVSFETKKSAATIDFELTQPAPQVVCQQCSQIIIQCPTCKYIGQAISIKDLDELNVSVLSRSQTVALKYSSLIHKGRILILFSLDKIPTSVLLDSRV